MSEFETQALLAEQGSARGNNGSVCISTNQVYDSCRDRDCIKDNRVYFTEESQEIINRAINVKVKSAEIIWVYSNVEEMPFNRGFYTVDIKYFIRVRLDAFRGIGVPTEVDGLTVYDKKVILFGSEGKTKSFSSKFDTNCGISDIWERNNLPTATVQTVDPVALSVRLAKKEECCCCCGGENALNIPENISRCFGDAMVIDDTERTVLVTLGLFTIVKIERNVELRLSNADFCVPQKECNEVNEENPCRVFETLSFPVDEFFPPQKRGASPVTGGSCGCDCRG